LGRVDFKLFNHFHYNPWSTPVENQERSAARIYQRDPLLYKWMVSESHNHPHGPEDFEQTQLIRGPDYDHAKVAVSAGKSHSHWRSNNPVHDHDHNHGSDP